MAQISPLKHGKLLRLLISYIRSLGTHLACEQAPDRVIGDGKNRREEIAESGPGEGEIPPRARQASFAKYRRHTDPNGGYDQN